MHEGLIDRVIQIAPNIFYIGNIFTIFFLWNILDLFLLWNIMGLFFLRNIGGAMKSQIKTSGQLGPVLKRLRMDRGWSQAELGDKIGLSQTRISKIESSPEQVTLDKLLTVLMALDASLSIEPRTSNDVPQTGRKDVW